MRAFPSGDLAEYEAGPEPEVVTNLHKQFVRKIRRVFVLRPTSLDTDVEGDAADFSIEDFLWQVLILHWK